MTRITSAHSLANLMRRGIATRAQSSSVVTTGTAAQGADSVQGCANVPAITQREVVLCKRVRSISPDDPKREYKAFRMFLESTMLAEFGEDVINDPAFYQLVESVHDQMSADPALEDSMREAARALIESATSADP